MQRAVPDTIAAVATPPGAGGIGIVRISGGGVPELGSRLLGALPPARRAVLCEFTAADGTLIDTGLALYFAAPASFTGEAVLELHAHGGPVVLDLLLDRVLGLGARAARPGEFSERAFLNGKLDLLQAEAIADLIESGTAQAARAAARSLQGAFSERVHDLVAQLTRLRMQVEAAIDFPDEDIDWLTDAALQQDLAGLRAAFGDLQDRAQQGRLLRDGLTLVIAGQPNAGKSSLLNALSGRDSAIVTAIPGTTRDLLHEQIQLDGMPLHLVDTAGLHESTDPVEQAGMQRARDALAGADHVLLVLDDQAGFTPADAAILAALPAGVPHTCIHNKVDLSGRAPGAFAQDGQPALALSLHTGAGLEDLHAHLRRAAGFTGTAAGEFSARRRHLDALARARAHVDEGIRQLERYHAGELLAEELRAAQGALGEITGEVSSDDLLGLIFSSFCIGK
ncbi:MAG: tRNA uridine-5-carboxymethylaminomethyl(34) synthesis GTPase MnmE [Pseudomonadota bacterium]